jgi:hypothetical protein
MPSADPDGIGAAELTFGAQYLRQIIVFYPLFEEYNRTKRLIVRVMRLLDEAGIGSRTVALPGTGESLVDLATVRFADWQATAAAHAGRASCTVAVRGGALLDGWTGDVPHWRLAPVDGSAIVRDLDRARRIAGSDEDGAITLLAGHRLNRDMLAALAEAKPDDRGRIRTIRLDSDPAPADCHIPFTPLWRRAQPGDDPELAAWMAQDIQDWIVACDGF